MFSKFIPSGKARTVLQHTYCTAMQERGNGVLCHHGEVKCDPKRLATLARL